MKNNDYVEDPFMTSCEDEIYRYLYGEISALELMRRFYALVSQIENQPHKEDKLWIEKKSDLYTLLFNK